MNIKATFTADDPVKKKTPPPAATDPAPTSFAAKNLALAYKIDGLIERGLVSDYSAAARLLQVSQPRLTHLMALRMLSPAIQEAILLGELTFGDKELRVLSRILDWEEQKAWVAARIASPRVRARASG